MNIQEGAREIKPPFVFKRNVYLTTNRLMLYHIFMSNLSPVPGYALITPDKSTDTPEEGIITTKDKQDYFIRGTIIKIGGTLETENLTIEPPAKEGDMVLYSASGYEDITLGIERVQVVKFSAIVGVYDKN